MKMKKLLLITLVCYALMIVSVELFLVSAEQQTLGTFTQGQTVNLVQACDNSTYSNITRIIYPNGTFAINQETKMSLNSTNNYNYSFSNTDPLDRYLVYGHCDDNGVNTNWVYDFFIKPKGIFALDFSRNIDIILIIIFFVVAGVLAFSKQFLWSGFVLLLASLILIFSKVNIIISLIVMALSVVVMFQGNNE